MKPNVAFINRVDKEETGKTHIIVWADCLPEITGFFQTLKKNEFGLSKRKMRHDIGTGYWVRVDIPTNIFDETIKQIKELFKNSKTICVVEHFDWDSVYADMLYAEEAA